MPTVRCQPPNPPDQPSLSATGVQMPVIHVDPTHWPQKSHLSESSAKPHLVSLCLQGVVQAAFSDTFSTCLACVEDTD